MGVSTDRSSSSPAAVVPQDIAPLRKTLAGAFEQGVVGLRTGPPTAVNDAARLFAAMFDPSVLERGSASSKKFDPTGQPIGPIEEPDPSFFEKLLLSRREQSEGVLKEAINEALNQRGRDPGRNENIFADLFNNLSSESEASLPTTSGRR